MVRFFLFFILLALFSCKTTTYYISRHAEKAGGASNDPPLTPFGEKQAKDLQAYLKDKRLGAIYSTSFIRTQATAKPTSDFFGLAVNFYSPSKSAALVDSLKAHNGRNVFIVGHSNTVDDLVNEFMGSHVVDDLPETEYGNLFIVQKKGKHYSFQKIAVPQVTR